MSIAMLALAIALLAVLMRMHTRLSDLGFDPEGEAGPSVHEVIIPIRVATALVSLAILLRGAELAQGSTPALISGAALLPALAYLNAYVWQFRATLRGTDLTVMTPLFGSRTYDLTRLIEMHDDPHGTWRLRFQGGEGCWVLKYLSGRNILRRALSEAQPYY